MSTTIQIETEVRNRLQKQKLSPRETYNDVLERLMDDLKALDEVTLFDVQRAMTEVDAGKAKRHEEVRQEARLGDKRDFVVSVR